jgi:hypothetical protein
MPTGAPSNRARGKVEELVREIPAAIFVLREG